MSEGGGSDGAWFGNLHPALRHCWHPVGAMDELRGDGPHPVRLLGDDWALFRSAGSWALLPDRCPHRYAPLTAGTVDAGGLRCAYHGWCFDGGGRCVEIPAIGTDAVPSAAHLRPAHEVVERYGLVWAALEAPVTPIPEVPEWGDDRYGLVGFPAQRWRAGAAQMADNFLDVGHFPFTHTGTIGDPDDQEVRPYAVVREGWVFTVEHHHSAKTLDASGATFERTMAFTCTAPHHVRLSLDYGPDGHLVLLFFHQPVDAGVTNLYCIELATNVAAGDVAVEDARAFQLRVAGEDRELLERLSTKAVTLPPGGEVHTRADRITLELRRVLAELARATVTTPGAEASTPQEPPR